ncbi:MAG TPA: serine/threonine-protein kinase [Thermoleophilaceae bacterium]|nr:serine/threonine-protein kinase [Thermoleophilaceae bacterium]
MFAGYRIEGVAGRGGMGIVYRATDLALERVVALKFIAADLASAPGFRDRFTAESKTAASLDHPNVLPILHAGEHDGVLYLVMRYVEGEDLRSALQRNGRFEPERAAKVIAQIASALDAAHASGLVHRDVKPANVLLAPDDHAYLTDFGLTKRLLTDPEQTRTGRLVGTLNYVAPEQVRGEQIEPRTDVYALGCVLFHLLTGHVPFPLDGNEAKLWAHVSEPPPSASSVAGAPVAFDPVIARAMAKRPDDRFETAGELGRAALEAAGTGGFPTHRPSPAPEGLRKPYSRRAYNRALVQNALTDRFNLLILGGMLAVGLLFGVILLVLPVALVVYGLAAGRSYFDEDAQEKVLQHERTKRRQLFGSGKAIRDPSVFSSRIADLMGRALQKDAQIRAAIDGADLPYREVSDEVDRFLATMWQTAGRAELLREGLTDTPPEAVAARLEQVQRAGDPEKADLVEALTHQLEVQRKMETQLRRFYDRMERLLVELDTVRGHLLTVSASTEADSQERLADDVRDLRQEMGAVAEGMAAAYVGREGP